MYVGLYACLLVSDVSYMYILDIYIIFILFYLVLVSFVARIIFLSSV